MPDLDEVLFEEEPRAYVYRGKKYPSVSDRLKAAGLCEDFSAAPKDRLENGLRRGRLVHLGCQYLDEGKGVDWASLDPRLEPYLRAHEQMIKDLSMRPIAIEKAQVAVGLKVGGRPDGIYWVNGQRVLIDRKSGSSHKKRDGKVQTGGYKVIWDYNHPKAPIAKRFIEKLLPTGKYKLEPCDDVKDMQVFLEVLKWGEINDKLNHWRLSYGYRLSEV